MSEKQHRARRGVDQRPDQRVRGGAHRGPRLTRGQRRVARRAAEAADLARTLAWLTEVRDLEDHPLEPVARPVPTAAPADDPAHDERWDRWAEGQEARWQAWVDADDPARVGGLRRALEALRRGRTGS